jgi:hypothetical protein
MRSLRDHDLGTLRQQLPQRGGSKTPEREAYERSPTFKDGQRFRAGIEGRISVFMRCREMKRCLAQGAEHFELFVGAAVLANNLMKIAGRRSNATAQDQTSHAPLSRHCAA